MMGQINDETLWCVSLQPDCEEYLELREDQIVGERLPISSGTLLPRLWL